MDNSNRKSEKKERNMLKKLTLLTLSLLLLVGAAVPVSAESEKKPVHIVMTDPYYGDASSPEGYKMVQDYILNETGILVDSYRFDSTTKTEKIALLLSSGEKLNLIHGVWTDYYKDGIIKPINDYLADIPNVVGAWKEFEGFNTVTASDGTVWGFPRISSRTFYQSFLRKDWMDKLGLQYPKTMDEYEKVLYALKDADPYGNGETITLITRGGMTTMEYHYLAAFTEHGRSNWWDEEKQEMKPYYLQEGYYDFLAKMHQWYKDGIIHPENYTWSLATVRSYLASGRVAASAAYSTDLTNQYTTMKQNYPGGEWWYDEKGMEGANGNKAETLIAGNDECQMMLSSNTEEESKAIAAFFNWGYSSWHNQKILQSGIEGVHWEYDTSHENARELFITKPLENNVPYNGDFWITIGAPMESKSMMIDPDGQRNYHNYMITQQKHFETCTRPFDLGVIYDDAQVAENVMSASDINTMVSEQILKFFIGERELTREEWAKFIEELYNIGLQDYINEYTRQYKEWTGK